MAENRPGFKLRYTLSFVARLVTTICLAGGVSTLHAWSIVAVEKEAVGNSTVLGGTVIPYKEVVLTAQMPGRVIFIAGSEGDSFSKNALLLSLDDDELQAKRQAVLASIYSANSALQNAQAQYNRELWSPATQDATRRNSGMAIPSMFDSMFTQNFASMFDSGEPGLNRQTDLIAQGTGMNQAHAALLQAQATLGELEAKIRDTKSMAPFEGVITDKLVEVGDTVQPGQPLLKFAHIKYLRVRVNVPVRLVKNLKLKQLVNVKLDGTDAPVKARVSRIYPVADTSRHTVVVKFDLPMDVVAGPGMYAKVSIPTQPSGEGSSLPVIPESAIVHRGSLPSVFVLNEDGSAEMRVVRTGSPVDRGMISISSGLTGNERVIDNPPPGIVSGWRPNEPR